MTSSSACASSPARRAGAPRSTTGSCPPRPGSHDRAVSFTKGCYPGQEPLARLQHRGHVNRSLRVLELDGEPARPADEIVQDDRVVGRVTSSVPGLALGYVRVEVPDGAAVEVAGRSARVR